MIDRSRISSFFRANVWRIPLLILSLIVAAAGYHACLLDNEHVGLISTTFDGQRMLVDLYGGNGRQQVVVDQDGNVRCILPNLPNLNPTWTVTGDLVFCGNCVLRFLGDGRVAREFLPFSNGSTTFFTPTGGVMNIDISTDVQGNFVRIRKDGNQIKRINFGSCEHAHPTVHVSPSGKTCFSFRFSPQQQSSSNSIIRGATYQMTDGQQLTTLILDPESADELFRFHGNYWPLNDDRHILYRNERNEAAIVAMKDPSQRLFSLPLGTRTIGFINGHEQVATYSEPWWGLGGATESEVLVHSLKTDASRKLRIPSGSTAIPTGNAEICFAANNGRIRSLNANTGKIRTIFTVRPWYELRQAIAFLGLPAIACAWLVLSRRRSQWLPILDLLFVVAIGCSSSVLWISVAGYNSGSFLAMVCPALFFLLSTLVVIWAMNTPSLVGHGVPVVFFGLASVLRLFRSLQRSSTYDSVTSFRELSIAALLISGMVVGLFVTRLCFKRLSRSDAEPFGKDANRLSIRQCLILTCAVAVFFGITRLVGMKIEFRLEKAVYFFGGYLFIAVFAAYVCGTYVKRFWLALFLFLVAIVGLFVAYEWTATHFQLAIPAKPTLMRALQNERNGINAFAPTIVGIQIRQYYWLASIQVILVASLIFAGMRYCLACGWRPIANRVPAV